jgi:hypothetical protein
MKLTYSYNILKNSSKYFISYNSLHEQNKQDIDPHLFIMESTNFQFHQSLSPFYRHYLILY